MPALKPDRLALFGVLAVAALWYTRRASAATYGAPSSGVAAANSRFFTSPSQAGQPSTMVDVAGSLLGNLFDRITGATGSSSSPTTGDFARMDRATTYAPELTTGDFARMDRSTVYMPELTTGDFARMDRASVSDDSTAANGPNNTDPYTMLGL